MTVLNVASARVLICGFVVSSLVGLITSSSSYLGTRERAHDAVMAASTGTPEQGRVIVVDIDRATLDQTGGWPWSRKRIANLLTTIASGNPLAIGVDILLEGDDRGGPRQLVGRLAQETGRADLAAVANTLPDYDAALAEAIADRPVVLGVGLDPKARGSQTLPRSMALRGRFDARSLWTEPGLVKVPKIITDRAAGLGLISIPGDPDGVTRRVPMLALTGNRLVPGLAVDLLRTSRRVSVLLLDGAEQTVQIGDRTLPLTADGTLRLQPIAGQPFAVVPAHDLLSGRVEPRSALTGRIVIVGSSAPEAGGTRTGIDGNPTPTLHLQAAAISQLERGIVPRRPPALRRIETLTIVVAAFGGGALGMLTATVGTFAAATLSVAWIGAALLAWQSSQLLLDPIAVPVALMMGFALSAILSGAITRMREARLRRRFEQHLAPAVVAALVDKPDALKLDGQLRTITALFTDIQGFTAMTARAAPHDLISVLDRYFDGVADIVIAHGGMVDKIVGDAVHAIFNAPLDTPDHAARAIACARAIDTFSEAFREEPLAQAVQFGQTRIGLDTGPAIVGDVGGHRKLDYTAHGEAVNAAARLEVANKQLGTRIAIGAGARAASGTDLRALGALELRGLTQPALVYTIWPDDFDETERLAEAAIIGKWLDGDATAVEEIETLSAKFPQDVPLHCLALRAKDWCQTRQLSAK